MNQQRKEFSRRDPVCRMIVSPTTAVAESRYQGKTYYFCADLCRQKFETEPHRYL
jgi:Cu+-exporting ATPase